MPTIFDNIDTPFLENPQGNGLRDALRLSHRGDFCVGYFNLRGWGRIDDIVEAWPATDPDVSPCRHLNKRGGVLVGDVVGLGKTRVACAIARVMGDDQMLECLILYPKNLVTMWETYAHQSTSRCPRSPRSRRARRPTTGARLCASFSSGAPVLSSFRTTPRPTNATAASSSPSPTVSAPTSRFASPAPSPS